MSAKFYACFVVQHAPSSGCREFGGVVEINPAFCGLNFDDVAEILAEDLDIDAGDVRVYHWSRLH